MNLTAMILAAGFGTRLRPLTDELPKPLIPVANRPLLAWCLDRLQAAGVRQVVINLHHLGDAIPAALGDGGAWGLRIHWSSEEAILGTGGGLVRARGALGDGSFFLLNGDVLSAVDLEAVLDFHRRLGAAATMVVRPLPAGADFTPLGCDAAGRLVAFKGIERPARGAVRPCMFCGLHVLEPAVFDHLPPRGFACVNDRGYAGMLRAGLEVGAYLYTGPWFDLGTPARYLAASAAVLEGRARLPGFAPPAGGVLVDRGAAVAASAELRGPLAVGAGCRIEPNAAAADAVLWPGSRLAAGQRLRAAVLTPHHRVLRSPDSEA